MTFVKLFHDHFTEGKVLHVKAAFSTFVFIVSVTLLVCAANLKQFIRHDMAYFATAKLKSVHSLLSLFSILLTTIFMFSTVSEGIPCLSTQEFLRIIMWQLIISRGSQLISQEISSDSLVAGERYFSAFKQVHMPHAVDGSHQQRG